MDQFNSKISYIEELIKYCEQSKLVSFTYSDEMFLIHFNKLEEEQLTTMNKQENMENMSKSIKNNMDNNMDEYAVTGLSQMDQKDNDNIITIVSPYVGTVEFSNQIKLGGNDVYIKKGDVICSVEAMKIYNDIKSPTSGTVVEILVRDCSLVEFEQPILKMRVDKNE